MIHARELPEAIEWHEGMLLAPQHFQQLALRHEALLRYHAGTVAPFPWGLTHVNIDRVLLMNGTFRVLSLEGVLPDGLVVAHESRDGQDVLELDLAAHTDAMRDRPLTIHVVVPVRRTRSNGAPTRYRSFDGPPVADETTGDGEIRIPRMRPRLALVAGDRVPDTHVGLPLARIRYQNDGYVLTEYVPPTLTITTASPLGKLCGDTVRRLREKAAFLAEQVRSPSLPADSPQSLFKRHQIHSMIGALPQVEALLQANAVHPFTLYAAFCGLAGHVSAVGEALVPPAFPAYDHEDPYSGFRQVEEYIHRVMDEGIHETHQAYVFQRKGSIFYLHFQPGWMGRKLVLAARARSGTTEKDVLRWVKNSIIGAESQVASLRQQRVLGVARRQVEEADGLVPGRGRILLELDADAPDLIPNEKLIVTRFDDRPDPEVPAELVLYVHSGFADDRRKRR